MHLIKNVACVMLISACVSIAIFGIPLTNNATAKKEAKMPELNVKDIVQARCVHGVLFIITPDRSIRIAMNREGYAIHCSAMESESRP